LVEGDKEARLRVKYLVHGRVSHTCT